MRDMIMLLLVLTLLSGSITQTYVHNVDGMGMSTIQEQRDLSTFIGTFRPTALEEIKMVCQENEDLFCSVEGTTITTTVIVEGSNTYYRVGNDGGIPLTTTTFRMYKLPTDLFDKRMNDILMRAELTSGETSSKPIDLEKPSENVAKAQAFRAAGLEINYTISLEGAEPVTYDIVALLEDSSPIVVKSTQVNFVFLIIAIGVIAVAAMAYSFFGTGRRRR